MQYYEKDPDPMSQFNSFACVGECGGSMERWGDTPLQDVRHASARESGARDRL